MEKVTSKTKRLLISIDGPTYMVLCALAKSTDRSMASYIRSLIRKEAENKAKKYQ